MFTLDKQIGQGTEAEVYSAIYKNTKVAIKRIKTPINLHNKREIQILRKLSHQNIIRIIDIAIDNNYYYIILELWDMTLLDIMHVKLEISTIRHIMAQLLNALQYIHANNYIHRDIKPSNILIKKELFRVAITDFGTSMQSEKGDRTPQMVTKSYRSPEILMGDCSYSASTDIWSLGCVFVEMLLHRKNPLFGRSDDDTELFVLNAIKKFDINKACSKIDPTARDLAGKMMCWDKTKRISAKEALTHKFFNY